MSHCTAHICILPLTAETDGLFSADVFAAMPVGSYFINGGRGRHVQEDELMNAVRSGQLAGAALDVFVEEPLPESASVLVRAPHFHLAARRRPDQS